MGVSEEFFKDISKLGCNCMRYIITLRKILYMFTQYLHEQQTRALLYDKYFFQLINKVMQNKMILREYLLRKPVNC
jgi:hypothetical protein